MSVDFKGVFEGMQKTLETNPEAARAQFSAHTRQVTGLHSQAKIRQFDLAIDEPPALAGTDEGPNPVELILAAFGACQEITYRLYADKLGIELNSVSVQVTGDLDLRGFFAVGDDARPGFDQIRAQVQIDSPAPDADIERLRAVVEAHCPVLDILANQTPVDVVLSRGASLPAVA